MRNRELEHVIAANLDLDERVVGWREQHPDGTLRDAVADLELWPKNPHDPDAQRLVWITLRHLGDPEATKLGFPAMRRMGVPAARDAAPAAPAVVGGTATGCAAEAPEADRRTT